MPYAAIGLTYVARGRYWVDDIVEEDGQRFAVLRLGKKIRCTVYDWCEGHYLAWDGTTDGTHSGPIETVHTFDHVMIDGQAQEVAVQQIRGDDSAEGVYVTIDVAAEVDAAGLRHLVEELAEVAGKLTERADRMKSSDDHRA